MNCWQTTEDSQCAMIQNRNKAQDINSKKITPAHAWENPRNTPLTALEKTVLLKYLTATRKMT